MDIKALAQKHNDYIIQQRRWFHAHPELTLEEVETTKAIKEQLESMGIEVTTFPDFNGLIGHIKGKKNGKTVMLRADIDALPMEEHSGEPFAATNGNMHSCGHDCHIAMLLGAAKILVDIKDNLCGNVDLIFQSAEESCEGAKYYIEKGVLDHVDAILGMHIWSDIDAPLINVEGGERMASCGNFKVTINGTAAHGAAPHLGKDAIIAAAAVLMNLQNLTSRQNDPLNSQVITIGTIHGGQRFNIISDKVVMEGTLRTYSRELLARAEENLRKVICGTAEALGCSAELDYRAVVHPLINEHDEVTQIVKQAVIKLYGEEALAPMVKLMGSEDFALYTEKVPGFFAFIGLRNPEIGAIYNNHSDKFKVDERALQRGSALYAQFAMDFLSK